MNMPKVRDYRWFAAKLDRVFSKWIRMRDCQDGVGNCISCGKLISYEQMDAGHFIGRQHLGTRWNEKNTHGQCRSCNRFNEGNKGMYQTTLISKYGPSILDELAIAKKLGTKRPSIVAMGIMISDYNNRLKGMK